MTPEEKDLLFIELSARLHYGVKVQTPLFENPTSIKGIAEDECWIYSDENNYDWINIEEVKPYLRPISSMTEKEKKELSNYENSVQRIDFFYSHHIDCRFMIEKGLALIAPEGMYKIE